MSPLYKIEMSTSGVLGSRERCGGGDVDEHAGVQPAGSSAWPPVRRLRMADACRLIGICRRRALRLLRGLRQDGASSLVSKRRGARMLIRLPDGRLAEIDYVQPT